MSCGFQFILYKNILWSELQTRYKHTTFIFIIIKLKIILKTINKTLKEYLKKFREKQN